MKLSCTCQNTKVIVYLNSRRANPRVSGTRCVKYWLSVANKCVSAVVRVNFLECDCLVYAAAMALPTYL